MGMLDLMSSTCRVFAPLVCGFLIDHVGVTSPFVFQACTCAIGFVLVGTVIGGPEQEVVVAEEKKKMQ